MVSKLIVLAIGMFAFGYAMVPLYKTFCDMTGINILAMGDRNIPGAAPDVAINTQVDTSRTITVEFDANSRGPWEFKSRLRSLQVHPGELATGIYDFQNVQNRRMAAQAIPSYAPAQAGAHFNKVECFCFKQYTLEPAPRDWPGRWIGSQSFMKISPHLLPYLELASILHIGKHMHLGCGTFALE